MFHVVCLIHGIGLMTNSFTPNH